MSTQHTAALVAAARAGDPRAQDELVSAHLPLVYNIVGRALNGSCDVDDVVQDTMLRALDGLGGLRADESFRSWLVAITMNRVRAHWQARSNGLGESGLEAAGDVADPGADFADLTVVRLHLAGQRRETARATRWLEPDDRALLSLWWLECAGELTRAEMAAALELSPQHTAVRVQRMKAQLEAARVVERALEAQAPCEGLRAMAADWDGRPSALWRKRIARHARECLRCSGLWNGLVPAEGLLAGLALVPVTAALLAGIRSAVAAGHGPAGAAFGNAAFGNAAFGNAAFGNAASGEAAFKNEAFADAATQLSPVVSGPGRAARRRAGDGDDADGAGGAGTGGDGGSAEVAGGRGVLRRRRQNRRRAIGGAVIAACVAGGGLVYLGSLRGGPDATEAGGGASASPLAALAAPASASAVSSGSASPSPSGSASTSPSPSASASVSPSPSPSAGTASAPAPVKSSPPPSRSSAPAPAPAPQGSAGQVVALVNKERAAAGCGPLREDAQLREAAQGHSADMAQRGFFSHTSPDGTDPGARTTAAGYRWSTYGENIAKGQQTPQQVMESWMKSPGHRANILNCAFKDIGVGIQPGAGGPWWTQNFGARM